MSASPSSHISPESSTRLASKSPNTASNNGDKISTRGSIQKHTKSRSGCKTCKRRKVKVSHSSVSLEIYSAALMANVDVLHSAMRSGHRVVTVLNMALLVTLPPWSDDQLISPQSNQLLLSTFLIWNFLTTSPHRPVTRSLTILQTETCGRIQLCGEQSTPSLSCAQSLQCLPLK